MNTKDPTDTRKSSIEDASIAAADDRERIATFAKAAYEGYSNSYPVRWASRRIPWEKVSGDIQCAWVASAKAVLGEARRVGWML